MRITSGLVLSVCAGAIVSVTGCGDAPAVRSGGYPIAPVPFTDVHFTDAFWAPRMQTNRRVTVPYCFERCEDTGRIANFARAGGLEEGPFEGIPFNDSDVFKVIEGAAYSLAVQYDRELDAYLDGLIATIAAAQEDDGYLYTARSLCSPEKMPGMSGKSRWSNLRAGHELYNVGHLYEAAVAHFRATGKRCLLDVALKNADLLVATFGPEPGMRTGVPGHEEIEIGLVKLFDVTRDRRYLDLAKFFIDQRGNADGHRLYGKYAQDHKPLVEQEEPVGHAVRAGYLYAGAADVAVLTGDRRCARALDRIWHSLVAGTIYLTGGVGAVGGHEGFGPAYVLPNKAYNETCAAVAMALWNHRMFLLRGEAKYIDLLERIVYNGFLSGISLSGNRFFYPNPLISHGNYGRSRWFDCACCPTNIVRFVPSLPGYVYAVKGDTLYINLFGGSTAETTVGGVKTGLLQETRYPRDGTVKITVEPERPSAFAVRVRIPGWARNRVLPSDLYTYADDRRPAWSLSVNGAAIDKTTTDGYVEIRRTWRRGDQILLEMTMPVRRVRAHEKVKADRGRVALERGPLVYCFEGVDNGGHLGDIVLAPGANTAIEYRPGMLGGVTVITATAARLAADKDGTVTAEPATVQAVPYYAWAHRDRGRMAVWLAANRQTARPVPPPSVASRSKVSSSHVHASIDGVNDQLVPRHSNDHDVPWLDWWPHRNRTEWLQYDFAAPATVSTVAVYWFDDTPTGGGCGLPASWRVLYRKDGAWIPVTNAGTYAVEKDRFNTVTFTPVNTDGLRLEVRLKKNTSAGVMEWRVK